MFSKGDIGPLITPGSVEDMAIAEILKCQTLSLHWIGEINVDSEIRLMGSSFPKGRTCDIKSSR